jgi:hypothetical protein
MARKSDFTSPALIMYFPRIVHCMCRLNTSSAKIIDREDWFLFRIVPIYARRLDDRSQR